MTITLTDKESEEYLQYLSQKNQTISSKVETQDTQEFISTLTPLKEAEEDFIAAFADPKLAVVLPELTDVEHLRTQHEKHKELTSGITTSNSTDFPTGSPLTKEKITKQFSWAHYESQILTIFNDSRTPTLYQIKNLFTPDKLPSKAAIASKLRRMGIRINGNGKLEPWNKS